MSLMDFSRSFHLETSILSWYNGRVQDALYPSNYQFFLISNKIQESKEEQ